MRKTFPSRIDYPFSISVSREFLGIAKNEKIITSCNQRALLIVSQLLDVEDWAPFEQRYAATRQAPYHLHHMMGLMWEAFITFLKKEKNATVLIPKSRKTFLFALLNRGIHGKI